jgi:IclR family pca regulon transcriptional regulator
MTMIDTQAENGKRSSSFISSLFHGLAVLEAVADSSRDVPLGQLAKTVGLNKTNAWRLAHTLVKLGYLRQDEKTRRFRLAPRVTTLGYAYFQSIDLKELANPFLKDLSSRLGETVLLAILQGYELILVDVISAQQRATVELREGSHLNLYNTALGRVLISQMSHGWLHHYTAHLYRDRTASSYFQTTGNKLLVQLKQIRDCGYALSDRGPIEGLRAAAAPIRNRSGNVVAALNILVPSVRATVSALQQTFIPATLQTAAQISAALGFKWRETWSSTSTMPNKLCQQHFSSIREAI